MKNVRTRPVGRRVLAAVAGFTVAGLTLSACSFTESNSGQAGDLTVAVRQPIEALDPQVVSPVQLVAASGLFEGLVLQNNEGTDVVPGIAESWDVSDDGLVYTFDIRDDAEFSDGTPITGDDVEWTFERLLSKSAGASGTAGANSYQASLGIKGAAEYLAGAITNWEDVGVDAIDPSTVEIELDVPNPDFLLGLTHYSMSVLSEVAVTEFGDDWTDPENWVGSGPFIPTKWNPNTLLSLVPNDHYWDIDNVHLSSVTVKVISEAPARLLAYQNGEVDVTASTRSDYADNDVLLAETASRDGYQVDYMNRMFSRHPAGTDPDVLRALSLSIDRETLSKVRACTTAGGSLVPDSVPGWDASLVTAFDVDEAKKLLARSGYPDAVGMPAIKILANSVNPVIQAVADMWQQNLGVVVNIEVVDLGVYVETRWATIEDPDTIGFYYGAFGGIPTLNNWLNTLWGPAYMQQFSLPADQAQEYMAIGKDESLTAPERTARQQAILDAYAPASAVEFAETVRAAVVEPDEELRAQLFLDAAAQREKLGIVMPLLWGPATYLVKPDVEGVNVRYTAEGFYYKGITLNRAGD